MPCPTTGLTTEEMDSPDLGNGYFSRTGKGIKSLHHGTRDERLIVDDLVSEFPCLGIIYCLILRKKERKEVDLDPTKDKDSSPVPNPFLFNVV